MKLHLAELSRRGVFKTLVAYAVASWVLIEVTDVIGSAFLLPEWWVAALTTALVLGAFPVVLLSWRYDITWEGIKRDTSDIPDEVHQSASRISVLLALLLLTVTAALWVNYFRAHSSGEVESLREAQQGAPEIGTDGQIQSIAVLPFDDFSPGGGKQLFGDGIAEAILHVLAKNKELVVTSRKSSFMFRNKDVSASEIGRILNVQALLEGSIQIVNDQLRVTSQLIRTSDQVHIWSNVYEAPLDDLFRINDEIALEVRNLVLPQNRVAANPGSAQHPPVIEAFQLLLEARDLIGDLESTGRAIRLMEVITQLWPDYSDAWAWLAMAYGDRASSLRDSHMASGAEVREGLEQSEKAAAVALELNPENAMALLIQGSMQSRESSAFYHAAIGKVIDLAPNDPQALAWLAGLSRYRANYARAETLLARARAVDPGDYEIFQDYLWSTCGQQPQIERVEVQLQNYPVARIDALYTRALAQFCDRHFVDATRTAIELARMDSNPRSPLDALLYLATLGDEDALALVGSVHRLVPREFNTRFDGLFDHSYFTQILPDRLLAYRGHMQSEFVSNTGTPRMYSVALMLDGDYQAAEYNLDIARKFWDFFYTPQGGRFWQSDTLEIYAFKAWFLNQRGETEEAAALAAELLQYLEQIGIAHWGGSRGRLGDLPLMILLLNGRQQQAVDWLLAAGQDNWLYFQPVLTSPVYAAFRETPGVAQALERMVAWRAGVLEEVMAMGLPEAEDPALLFEMLTALVRPTHHEQAQVALHFNRDPAGARRHYQKALEKAPDNLAIIEQLAELALASGEVEEAIALRERAVSLSPGDSGLHDSLSFSYACSGRWSDALASARMALQLAPGDSWVQRWVGLMLILDDQPQKAMNLIRQISNERARLMSLVLAHYALGEQAQSDELLAQWLDTGANVTPFHLAYTLAYRGDNDLAFEWLYKAAALGRQVSNAAVHPFLLKLHDDPRWIPFLESIGKAPANP